MERLAGGWIAGDRDDPGIETSGARRERNRSPDRAGVRKYLERGLSAPVYGPRAPSERLATRFQRYLLERLEAFPGLSARRLHRELREMGYRGAYSTLTEYLRLIRPLAPQRFERRFETPAGLQAQVDFAEFQTEFSSEPGVTRKVWLFSMVLGCSRLLWGRFCPNQTLETVLRCHIDAFEATGGACAEILYDRMKTAVLGEDAAGVVTYNPSLVAMLDRYGCAPRACRPYRAKTKGKVERPFRYVRQDFFLGRVFRDLADLNAQFFLWLAEIANARRHATTGRIVQEHFAEERPQLKALPAGPYEATLTIERRVSHEGMVSVGGNLYSVPETARKRVLEIQTRPRELRIFEDGTLIAVHPILEGKGLRRIDPTHRKAPPPSGGRSSCKRDRPPALQTQVVRRSLEFYEAVGRRLAAQPGERP